MLLRPPKSTTESILLEAQQLTLEQDFDKAINCYTTILSKFPRHQEALIARSKLYAKTGKKALADKDLQAALAARRLGITKEANKEKKKSLAISAAQVMRANKYELAAQLYKDLISLDPEDATANEKYVLMKIKLGQTDTIAEDLSTLENLIDIDNVLTAPIHLTCVKICLIMNNLEGARSHFIWSMRNRIYNAADEYYELMTSWNKKICEVKETSQSVKNIIEEADRKCKKNKYKEAIDLYSLALTKDVKNHLCYSKRAAAFIKIQNYEFALLDFTFAKWLCEMIAGLKVYHEDVITYLKKMIEMNLEIGEINAAAEIKEDIIQLEWNRIMNSRKFNPNKNRNETIEAKWNTNQSFADQLVNQAKKLIVDDEYEKAGYLLDLAVQYSEKDENAHVVLANLFRRNKNLLAARVILYGAEQKWPRRESIQKEIEKIEREQKRFLTARAMTFAFDEVTGEEKQILPDIKELKHVEKKIDFKKIERPKKKSLSEEEEVTLVLDKLVRKVEMAETQRLAIEAREIKEASHAKEKEEQDRIDKEAAEKAAEERRKKDQERTRKKNQKITKRRKGKHADKVKLSHQEEVEAKKSVVQESKGEEELEVNLVDAAIYTRIANIPLRPFEKEILNLLEKSGKNNVALMVGGSVRSRLKQVLANSLAKVEIDPKKDVDVVTNASEEEIMTALKKFDVQPSKRRGLFHFRLYDENGDEITVEVWQSQYKTLAEDALSRDYTINALYADKSGYVYDPITAAKTDTPKSGFKDLKNNDLITTRTTDVAFEKDPIIVLRGASLAYKHDMNVSPKMRAQIERYSDGLSTMKEKYRLHCALFKMFSSLSVSPEQAITNFQMLIEWNLLDKLFSPEAAEKLINDQEWIYQELQYGPVSRKHIYMIFYTSIAMQAENYDPINTKKSILSENALLNDELNNYPGFGGTFSSLCKRYQAHPSHKADSQILWRFFKSSATDARQAFTSTVVPRPLGSVAGL